MTHHTVIKTTKVFLVVFCFLLSCKETSEPSVDVIYESEKAIAVTFNSQLETKDIKVFLSGNLGTPVLGSYRLNGEHYTFEPIIPFSAGKTYLIHEADVQKASFTINSNDNVVAPELLAIYPSTDTVPENLLKMYFQFSKPMQEVGSALDFITVTNTTTGKEVDVFLELTTELWNNEHTQLTLWLDPGRIKTDLIPNKERGLPILKDNTYRLTIDSNWPDAEGNKLNTLYEKVINVVKRDADKPNISDWEVLATLDVLTIHFNEPLDGVLASKAFHIKNSLNESVSGDFELINKEQTLLFHPKHPFALGEYSISIESRLEDLAGNNLNHPFDNDLTKKENQDTSEFKTLPFIVKKAKL